MGLGSSLLNAFYQIQRCLGIDTLALHANQPHLLKIQGCVDVQALPARRCLDRRPVVLMEPSMGWSGLVLGVHRIDEDPLLVRRQAVHKAFILRNKILLRRRVRMLRQPLRPFPVEAETVHQLDRSRMRVLNPEGLSQPRPHHLRIARRLRPVPPARPSDDSHAPDTPPNPTMPFHTSRSRGTSGALCRHPRTGHRQQTTPNGPCRGEDARWLGVLSILRHCASGVPPSTPYAGRLLVSACNGCVCLCVTV